MGKKLPFLFPSQIAWRSAGSGVLLAAVAYALASPAAGAEATRSFGFGSFALLVFALVFLTLQFSEWRAVKYSLVALIITLGIFLSQEALVPTMSWIHGGFAAGTAGALALLLFVSAALHRDPKRLAPRILHVALTFLAALLLFAEPSLLTFAGFVLATALLARDEVKSWSALRVGEGRLIGAAVGLIGAELAAFAGLLPLGPVRAAALTALALLLAREGLKEAYQGDLRRELVFQGFAVFFVLSVLLFASTSWTL